MRWTGKLLGAVFGYMTFGALGALLGVYIGHKFDTGMAQNPFDPERQQRTKTGLPAAKELNSHVY
mgnify:CR=1 FL=1